MTAPTDVSHLVDRRLTVDLGDATYPLIALDWPALVAAQGALVSRAQELSGAERDDLLNGVADPVTEVFEYFLFGNSDEVSSGRWLPFAVVGLDLPGTGSFAETFNDGLLVFDLTRADAETTPVLWVREDEVLEVADDLSELPITERSSDDA